MTEELTKKDTDHGTSNINIRVSDDKMTVYLSVNVNGANTDELLDDIESRLRLLKISAKQDVSAINDAIKSAQENGTDITDLPIAFGVKPIKAVDGKIEWTENFFDESYYVDPVTKKIDFRQKVNDRSVEKDQLLVKVFRAKTGKNGRDVFGNVIVVPHPRDVKINSGSNVYWSDKHGGYCARCSGRVKLRGNIVDVDPVYYARNGVNNETGNIKHNGQVLVDGDVDSELKIEAAGDIEIRGIAYACDICCGGNLISKEGINSQPDRKIRVKNDIMAKYLMNADVKAGNNIIVNKEIYQCRVETKGELHCAEGRIIGGEIYATKGLIVGEVGSKGNVKTLLAVGIDKALQAKRLENAEEIKRLKEAIKKLEVAYKKFKANLRILNAAQKEAMTEIEFKMHEGKEEIQRIDEENKRIYDKILENSRARITIMGIVNPGTILKIADSNYRIDTVLKGPLYAFLDRLKGEVILASKEEVDERDRLREEMQKEMEAKKAEEENLKDAETSNEDNSDEEINNNNNINEGNNES